MSVALEVCSILVVGWVAGAESGSWSCVQPLVERLPYEQQIAMEQGMLRTFGRIMPILMPLSGILAVATAIDSAGGDGGALWLRIAAAACVGAATITTLVVNVPINARTGRWQPTDDNAEWSRMRTRWHVFQGVRSILLVAAFIMLAVALAVAD